MVRGWVRHENPFNLQIMFFLLKKLQLRMNSKYKMWDTATLENILVLQETDIRLVLVEPSALKFKVSSFTLITDYE